MLRESWMIENVGERLFVQYAVQEGYPPPRKIAADTEETADFELQTRDGTVICEVKHFPRTPQDQEYERALIGIHASKGHPGWNRVRDNALRRAKGQLERYRGRLAIVVLVDTRHPLVSLDDDAVIEAMLGKEKLAIWTDKETGEIRGQATYLAGHGRIRHPANPAPWVSAVTVLEEFQPDDERFYDLVEERMGEIPDHPNAQWFKRWNASAQELRREQPDLDPDRTVLRMRVFENPEAEIPLPRTSFAGTYDLRYGAFPDGTYGLIR